ncbi:MAG: M1 family metallopeptidase [Synechococcales bacterium]|nr:M1 family metallopeptidase [Synechococcales bacterium]
MLEFGSARSSQNRFELPGAKPQYVPDRPGQVEHIFLDLQLDLGAQRCQGTCQIRMIPVRSHLTSLVLDAVNLQIAAVRVDDLSQLFQSDGQKLTIQLSTPTQVGKPLVIAIDYSLHQPQRGMYFIQPSRDYPHKPIQVWTQGEDEDSRYWFPCFDYPGQLASSEIRVEVPQSYLAISNGELIATEGRSHSKVFHWRQTEVHPTYLMTLVVGEFVELREDWQGKPITYYVQPGQEAAARLTLGKTPAMMAFFSQTYGYPYPYSKYAQVCVSDYIFGGMENTSTTLLTDRCLLDDRAALDNLSSETLVAHELAHQWFGDLVVIKHWSHAWIKEGMASYAEVMWLEQEYGKDLGAYYLLGQARDYLSEDADRYRRPLVTHVYREAIELYDSHIYEKGACIYHMIRAELGEELFFATISTFLRDNAHSTVETIDLLRAIDKATGRNLLFLFDQYVYRGGYPQYKVSYTWDEDSNLAQLTITQTQAGNSADLTDATGGLFDLKLPIRLTTLGESATTHQHQTYRIRVCDREQSFYFPLAQKPDFISFDRGNAFLKTVELDYPLPELKAQLQFDEDPISRIYAAEALAKKGGLEALQALAQALQQDIFWGVRLEVARQLGNIKLDQVVEALLPGLQDPEARVRCAVVETLATIPIPAAYQAVKAMVETGDPSYVTEAAAIASLGTFASSKLADAPDEAEVLALLQQVLETRAGWNEVVRMGALQALSCMTTSAAALELLLSYTIAGTPQPLRLAAIRALGSISVGQAPPEVDRILTGLKELSRDPFFFMQAALIKALQQMETVKVIPILQALGQQSSDGRIRRSAEEAIAIVQKRVGTHPAIQQLHEDLEQLKRENQELKSRLASLEAKTTHRP